MSASAMAPEDVRRIEQALYFEPPQMRLRLTRFIMLMFFASVIASGGLVSDSVASVIGAMIVAPLMTPIMGMVVAVVTGSGKRFVRSLLIVSLGAALAIAIGWLMASLMPLAWETTSSSQIISRTSPRLLDLVVALASGGAGAYALSRVDVADALPGVAIAISLVPPLNTVGVLLAASEGELAAGALVLFLTNMGAILLAGTITFMVTGLATAVGRRTAQVRAALIAIVMFVALIAIPLRANSNRLWQDATREDRTLAIVHEWLEPAAWEVYEVRIQGNNVDILLGGEGDLPPAGNAIQEIHDVFGEEVTITTRIVDVRKEVIAGTPVSQP